MQLRLTNKDGDRPELISGLFVVSSGFTDCRSALHMQPQQNGCNVARCIYLHKLAKTTSKNVMRLNVDVWSRTAACEAVSLASAASFASLRDSEINNQTSSNVKSAHLICSLISIRLSVCMYCWPVSVATAD